MRTSLQPKENTGGRAAPGSLGSFRLLGVPVRLHYTFVLLVVFLVVIGLGERQTAGMSVLYVFLLFASILLHEFGHALAARLFGISTLDIVMFPIGGASRLERSPKPREEFWISLTGPSVNLLIAATLLAFLIGTHRLTHLSELAEPADSNLLARIAIGNLILGLFNLIPAFPMDGGRMLRAVLRHYKAETEATRIAAAAGRMLAISMGLYGVLTGHLLLVFVAFFVYQGAAPESAAAMGRALTHGVPVRAAMVTEYHTLSHGNTIRDAANLLLATSQQDFPVVYGEQVIGLLGRNSLLRGMAVEGPDAYIAGVMDREFTAVAPDMDLAEALPLMANAGACALVMQGEELLGLLTTENLSQFLLLRRFGMELEANPQR